MAQHDYVIDNGPGLTVRTDINAAFAAIRSSNSGAVAPASVVAGQLWFNTTTGQLQMRNAGNTAWVGMTSEMGGNVAIDTTNNYLQFTGTTPNVGTALLAVRDNRTTTTTTGNAVFSVKRQNSTSDSLLLGNDGNSAALIGGANVPMRFGNWVSGVFTESLNVSAAGQYTFLSGSADVIIGAGSGIEIVGAAPNIKFTDNTASAYDFWAHADGNTFYILVDRDGNGSWDTPHPLSLAVATGVGQLFGNTIYTTANLPPYPVGVVESTGSTIVARDPSGDINVRLVKSEYDVTNASIGFIMTQIDTATNNYVRPSTPAQVAAALSGMISPPMYTGSNSGETNFPVGTILAATVGTGEGIRNQAHTLRIWSENAGQYVTVAVGGTGANLSGTWRCRGMTSYAGSEVLFQRVA